MRPLLLLALAAAAGCGASIGDAAQSGGAGGGGAPDAATPGPPPTDSGGGDAALDAPSADAPSATFTGTSMLVAVYTRICGEAFACEADYPSGTGSTFTQAWGSSPSSCVTLYNDYFGASHVDGDVANGKIQFDPSAAEACVAGIAFGTCAQFFQDQFTYPQACSDALVGSVPDGGTCNSAYECSDGSAVCPNRVCTTTP